MLSAAPKRGALAERDKLDYAVKEIETLCLLVEEAPKHRGGRVGRCGRLVLHGHVDCHALPPLERLVWLGHLRGVFCGEELVVSENRMSRHRATQGDTPPENLDQEFR